MYWVIVITIHTFLTVSCNGATKIDSKAYSSYRPVPLCKPSHSFRYPTSTEDVVKIVKEAIAENLTVKAFGSRHSQTDIICTDGIPIENFGLKSPMRINPDGTATFGAGLTLFEATEFLLENGRGFRTTPAFGNITLGGAIGTGAHGSTIKYTSSISTQVIGLTIVDGGGNIRSITSEEDLNAFRVHLGLLGIVIDITLVTKPLYKTSAFNYIIDDDVLVNGTAQKWAKEADQMSLYWFPSSRKVVVANWTIVDVDTPGEAFTNDHVPSTYGAFNLAVSTAMETFQTLTENSCSRISNLGYTLINALEKFSISTLYEQTPAFVPIYTEDGVVLQNPAVGYYNRMFAPTCMEGGPDPLSLQCLWSHGPDNITILDNEVTVDLDDMPDFINSVKEIISIAPAAFPIQGILLRFSAKSSVYMSSSYNRTSVHFEFYLFNRKDKYRNAASSLAAYQTIMQTLVKKYRGRPHWGKNGPVYHTKEIMDLNLDPTAREKFKAAMAKFDPNGVFMNKFGRRLKGIGTALDTHPAVIHCGLTDDCFCSINSDCASYQRCTTLPGYKYPVCQTIGETPIEYYPNITVSDQNVVSWISDTVPNLISQITSVASLCIANLNNILRLDNVL